MRISSNSHNKLFLLLTIVIIIAGTSERLSIAYKAGKGGDYNTHIETVEDLIEGRNPYTRTLETYENLKSDPGNKGYAYLPAIMYTNAGLYITNLFFTFNVGFPLGTMPFLMHLPSILAGVFISLFFIKLFYKSDNWALIFSVLVWSFNPYFYYKNAIEGYDVVAIALLLWALYYLKKDDVISGALYALSVIFKTFPIILGFIFILGAKDKKKLVISGFIIFILFSIPFLKSFQDFSIYLQGSLLVHGDRFVQGRPFLYYLSYLYDIITIRLIPFKYYSLLSVISGWVISIILYSSNAFRDKFKLSVFPFLSFYLIAPVLNRTYLVWGIPIFLIGSYRLFKERFRVLFYILNIGYWLFAYWYLAQWTDGFHIHARL